MRHVNYKRHEPFRKFPEHRNELLAYFLLDVPYLLYFGVIPSREAINQVLATGGGGGGMSPGASWLPFEISDEEYWEVVEFWGQMEIQEKRDDDRFRYDPRAFFQDWDVMRETDHLAYLRRSRDKYAELYFPKE